MLTRPVKEEPATKSELVGCDEQRAVEQGSGQSRKVVEGEMCRSAGWIAPGYDR